MKSGGSQDDGFPHPPGSTVHCKKTTVELPDELLLLAKQAALERRTTLKALILNGLSRELKDSSSLYYRALDGLRQLDSSAWEGIRSDDYVTSIR
jgi:hypothetical protein